jgi:alpha-galactosidase
MPYVGSVGTAGRYADHGFSDVAEIIADPATLQVYEHGWQSFSPAGVYPGTGTSPRPRHWLSQTTGFRPERPAPKRGFQGEGLLAVTGADGTILISAVDPTTAVPSIRAQARADRMIVSSDGPVNIRIDARALAPTVESWADELAAKMGVGNLRTLPTGWCSWYCYWRQVSERDILDNLAAMDRLDLDVGVVQVDDGYQSEVGDWLTTSDRFRSLSALASAVTATDRQAGIWTAPFLVGERSKLANQHPDWLVGGAVANESNWDQRVLVLDVTHPKAAEHLRNVYRSLADDGFSYYKIDFLYAGALSGRRQQDASPLTAYREGLQLIRQAVGPNAILLGSGAPLLPSIGLVDAMRVSPDVDLKFEPAFGDMSQAGIHSAIVAGRARSWQHGRFWVNDPDCLIVRAEVSRRDDWANHVASTGGLKVSSDPLSALDEHGLELTRRLLRAAVPNPVTWDPVM